MGLGSFAILTGLILTAGLYIITSLSFYFILRKAGYRNTWMAFVPVLSTYKQLCLIYDYFKGHQVLDGTMSVVKYQDVRRNFVSSATVAYIILLVVGAFLLIILLEFSGIIIEDSTVDIINNVTSAIVNAAIGFFILRSFINKESGERLSSLVILVLIVLGIVTLGFSWIAVYFYFGLNNKHYYAFKLDDLYVNEEAPGY